MKNIFLSLLLACLVYNCASSEKKISDSSSAKEMDTITIKNDSLNYEIIIFEIGFNSWLATQPPEGHYAQSYLEQQNWRYVTEYNTRANSPNYDRNLYPFRIEYQQNIDYGYEVNYLLYNYFEFFQEEYNEKL